jgi:hypothetical protein
VKGYETMTNDELGEEIKEVRRFMSNHFLNISERLVSMETKVEFILKEKSKPYFSTKQLALISTAITALAGAISAVVSGVMAK